MGDVVIDFSKMRQMWLFLLPLLTFLKIYVGGFDVVVVAIVCGGYSRVVASFVGVVQIMVDTLIHVEKLCQYKKLHSHHQYNYYFQLLL